ncbi:uncharacterized protein BO87DRAFT_122825 [Aspergillus neoniger CBS 115656]|uniref:Uncharacterized protein n=1 Tax=Aspergillus neoniger (strain CBS 115656) TaxID=1448310 RepID=A0A318YB32_ASPNB|nr:hypothetical protein BO87DRAFT_122825 [Aspergillus neoniger CBS 115656]PYH31556.1 hypothetical protein BO87DRAFT_122825 [Aspergillus neoniger CBS 115656]
MHTKPNRATSSEAERWTTIGAGHVCSLSFPSLNTPRSTQPPLAEMLEPTREELCFSSLITVSPNLLPHQSQTQLQPTLDAAVRAYQTGLFNSALVWVMTHKYSLQRAAFG